MSVRPARTWLWLALLVHLLLAGTYAWRAPAWEGPDENDHAYYASFLRATGQQPTILQSAARTGRPAHEEASLGHHPPLYYFALGSLSALIGTGDYTPCWAPNPDWGKASALKWQHGSDEVLVSREIWMLRALRGMSVLLGAISLALTWALARVLLPAEPAIANAATILLSCLPQWSWMHGVLDNGNLATTLALATTLVLARGARARRLSLGTGIGLGLLLGTALLTKLTALYLLPVVGLAYVLGFVAWRDQRRAVLQSAALALLLAVGISGAWFWRNATLYGDPLALAPHAIAYASNRVPPDMRASYLLGDFIWHTLHSTFAGIGWSALRAPRSVVYVAAALVLLALLGLLARARAVAREGGLGLLLAVTALALTVAGLVQFNLAFFQPQGRYLFPGSGVAAILLAAGWHGLRLPRALHTIVAAVCVAGAFLLQHLWFLPDMTARTVADPLYASLHAGLHTAAPIARRTLIAEAPAPAAALDAAPTFRWRDPEARPDGAYSVILVFKSGLAFASFETGHLVLRTTEWTLPDAFWSALPIGEPIRWRVRRIANRAQQEAAGAQPETPEQTLVRTR